MNAFLISTRCGTIADKTIFAAAIVLIICWELIIKHVHYINFGALDSSNYVILGIDIDRLCGLVVKVSGYRYRGPGFDSRRYQIF